MYFRQMQEFFCVFLYFFVRAAKRRAEKGRRGVWGGVVEDGEAPRGGANAGEQHLVDEWFKGWLGGVCCMEWLGGGTMSVFGQCPDW